MTMAPSAYPGSTPVVPRPHSPRGSETWQYSWPDALTGFAILLAILSVIGGIVLSMVASKYTTVDNSGLFSETHTHHHGIVVVYWLFAGLMAAAFWMMIAVGLKLLAEAARSLHTLANRSDPAATQTETALT